MKKVYIRVFYLIALILFALSCTQFPDPTTEVLKNYSFSPIGNNQRSLAGEVLRDSVGVRITNYVSGIQDTLKVRFELLNGNGEIESTEVTPGQSGIASIWWKVGNINNTQNLKALILEKSGKELGSVLLSAYAFHSNRWDTVPYGFESNLRNVIADTVNKTTLLSSGTLFTQGNHYFEWEPIQFNNSAYSIVKDKNNYYLGSWDGNVYRSTNQGNYWSLVKKPVWNYTNYVLLKTTPGVLWASTNTHTLLSSRNEGESWQLDTIGIPPAERMTEIKQAPNGNIFLITGTGKLYKSEDKGKSWKQISISATVRNIYITLSGEIVIAAWNNEHTVYLSKDNAVSFENVFSVNSSFSGIYYNFVTSYKGKYLVLFPGNGLYLTTNFRNYTQFWLNQTILDVFKDHNDILIAKDNQRVYYYNGN